MRTWRSTPLAAACAVGAAVAISACGSSASEVKHVSGNKTLTIGVSYPTSNNPFWQRYLAFMQQTAGQLGVKIDAVSADNNEQKQLSDVESLVSKHVDGFIITPQSTAVGRALLRTAAHAGIPAVVTDRYPGYAPGVVKDANYDAFVGPDDVQSGAGIANALIKEFGATKLLAIGGTPGSSVTLGRQQGLEKAVGADHAQVVQYVGAGEEISNGLQATQNMLQAHKPGTANGIWCYNDALCMGAIKALQTAGRSNQFKVGGEDLTPEGLSDIKAGTYQVSFGGHWLEGGFGLIMLYDAVHGKTLPQKVVKLHLIEVTKKNLAQFEQQYINHRPDFNAKQIAAMANPATAFKISLR